MEPVALDRFCERVVPFGSASTELRKDDPFGSTAKRLADQCPYHIGRTVKYSAKMQGRAGTPLGFLPPVHASANRPLSGSKPSWPRGYRSVRPRRPRGGRSAGPSTVPTGPGADLRQPERRHRSLVKSIGSRKCLRNRSVTNTGHSSAKSSAASNLPCEGDVHVVASHLLGHAEGKIDRRAVVGVIGDDPTKNAVGQKAR